MPVMIGQFEDVEARHEDFDGFVDNMTARDRYAMATYPSGCESKARLGRKTFAQKPCASSSDSLVTVWGALLRMYEAI